MDILVQTSDHIRPAELRAFTENHCPVLDLFLVEGAKAISAINESYVQGTNFDDLVNRLQGLNFWTREEGFLEGDIDWEFIVAEGIDFVPTAMISGVPESFNWSRAAKKHFSAVEAAGLPTRPYLGYTPSEVSVWLEKLILQLPTTILKYISKGKGVVIKIYDEYDLQDFFYIVAKPWLANLTREEVTIEYDGQKKKADFSLFDAQIVIEMKHIKDANSKAAVLKTLSGLTNFYKRHPNIRVMIFVVLVNMNVTLDDRRIEVDFSYREQQPEVHTVVLRNEQE
jgi:hypothetical protein